MKVVLFCGGMGTRLGNSLGNVPKPMVKIGYRPILWHIMKYYAHFGHKEFILCLGYRADVIKDYFLNYNECISNDFTMSKGGKDLETCKPATSMTGPSASSTRASDRTSAQRLKAVEPYVADEEMFMANYADGLTDMNLNEMVEFFKGSGKMAGLVCVRPSQSFHVVHMDEKNLVKEISYVRETNTLINGGFFIFKKEIFNYIGPGEELVIEPFRRLIAENQLIGYRCDNFWCMDTFKEHQELNDMHDQGKAPWEVWKNGK